jgi:hypothetical protein
MRTDNPAVSWTSVRTLVCGVVALTGGGCGSDDELARRYPVSGQVQYKGEPLVKGRINFIPEDKATGRPASADIADGAYRLTTQTPEDGALPGAYQVSIVAVEQDAAAARTSGGMPFHVDLGKAKRVPLIPKKYFDPALSGLTAEVKPTSNTINFDLHD